MGELPTMTGCPRDDLNPASIVSAMKMEVALKTQQKACQKN